MKEQQHIMTTGGSSCIGLALATGYISMGQHLTIIGRNPERLATAGEILKRIAVPGNSLSRPSLEVHSDQQGDYPCHGHVRSPPYGWVSWPVVWGGIGTVLW